jgi:transcriptional antiterminator
MCHFNRLIFAIINENSLLAHVNKKYIFIFVYKYEIFFC